MIQDALVSRRRLLDLLQSPASPSEEPRDYAPPLPFGTDEDAVRVIWRNDDDTSGFPAVILVEHRKQRDFFAWVTSFVPWVQPFTAFCRVVDPKVADLLLRQHRPPLAKLVGGWVGVVLAETFVLRALARVSDRFTIRQAMGTFSYCASRRLALGLNGEIGELFQDWESAKELIENRRVPYSQDIRELWDIVGALSARHVTNDFGPEQEAIFQCCADILEDGQAEQGWFQLTRKLRVLDDVPMTMTGTREERVILAERVLREVAQASGQNKQIKSFACGYIVSLIAPGSLDHIGLLEQIIPVLPTAPLWYGLCAGLRNRNGVQSYSNGIGRRLARELERGVLLTDAPTGDIAMAELRVVVGSSRSTPDFLRNSGTSIEVEVAPCVSCWFRSSTVPQEAFAPPVPTSELRGLLEKIEDLSYRVEAIQREGTKLADAMGLSSKDFKRRGRK